MSKDIGERSCGVAAGVIQAIVLGLFCLGVSARGDESVVTSEHVGRQGTNRFYTPSNQVLTPAGTLIELPGMRPQAVALSPDGKLLVTSGKTHDLVVIDPVTSKILQNVALPSETNRGPALAAVSPQILEPDKEGQLSFTGLIFSADGTRIYLANVDGSIKVFGVEASGKVVPMRTLKLPRANAPHRKPEIPAGLALSLDGKRLYVAGNLSNRLLELDVTDGKVLRLWEVGVAPYDVVIAGPKAYVSNWGGRRPEKRMPTGPAGRGMRVRVDPVRFIANEGSVSVIDLGGVPNETGTRPKSATSIAGEPESKEEKPEPLPVVLKAKTEILTGPRACAMALAPNGRHVLVANSGSDTISVIDTRTDRVLETICARPSPVDLFGAQPNALAFDKAGKKLFVCNGTQNTVAVFQFNPGSTKLIGLLPVGWFPGAIAYDSARNAVYVANIKGLSPGRPRKSNGVAEFNSHQYHGSLSLVKVPSGKELAANTRLALANMRYPLLRQAALPPRAGRTPVPVPERVGEPSMFKHVVYIIKENRTYDQVLGDLSQGNGDAELCTFGEKITPNQHKLTQEFVLLDNTYCSSILSADGHQWADSAFATDYMERSFAGFPRSYPDGMEDSDIDALAYSPAGFIWDNALAHGKSIRDYGEFAITHARWADPRKKEKLRFLDFYRDFTNQTGEIKISSRPAIESLRPYLATNTVGWDLAIPDVFRAAQFIKELKQFEQVGRLPNFILICLPNDHTSGTAAHSPTPAAQVADNDLAFGQIVEALSHSRFWPETCIFAIEDDPQSGWDHVSGYRTTAYVASPYTRRGAVVSTQYNHTSLLRTMELILGLPPMNQLDATATPMTDCFTNRPDLTPFTSLANNIPLDQMNPEPKKISDPLLRKNAYASNRLPLAEADKCPDDLLNRILWYAMKGSQNPYPEWAVRTGDDD